MSRVAAGGLNRVATAATLNRVATALGALALLVFALAPPERSGANFTSRHSNAGASLTADTPANYLRLYSQSTDPAGLGSYAVKRLSSPAVAAATGVDKSLRVALGNYRTGGNVNRAFTVQVPATLPAGVTQVTVTMTFEIPARAYLANTATMATIAAIGSGNAGGSASLTLAAAAKRQVNIAVPALPGTGTLYAAFVHVRITYPGYTGTFLNYDVPVTVWDGAGAGP
jgi:hypothetical protein